MSRFINSENEINFSCTDCTHFKLHCTRHADVRHPFVAQNTCASKLNVPRKKKPHQPELEMHILWGHPSINATASFLRGVPYKGSTIVDMHRPVLHTEGYDHGSHKDYNNIIASQYTIIFLRTCTCNMQS